MMPVDKRPKMVDRTLAVGRQGQKIEEFFVSLLF
jgi:hypothetical protein